MHYKREGLDIMMMLLSNLRESRTITQVMHAARLDTRTASKYVQMLLKKGLIERVEDEGRVCYTITEKGSRLLFLCEELKGMLKDSTIEDEKGISLVYI
ncbi:MAG: winged helix-turn-helix domain-containing protein [Candidatus Nitrosocaldus sp.]|nr:winged helix DNA-binding protein [Candidatus Nitrosocaldus sp.]MCS7140729.1 winged helix DNA-binding protein [Candidatus Nitrosocaldus sp.]MDW7999456.1 winged helix-turn-helix domain-containing protein [Candidatus Nitrosocaldus sp.]MDW8275040.1 winged helix-turn-helix domain-containing protein [Candidatus Nitrosocaldus sp.]